MSTNKLLKNIKLLFFRIKKLIPVIEVKIEPVTRHRKVKINPKNVIRDLKRTGNITLGLFKYWLVPIVLSVFLIFITRPSYAQIADYDTRLAQYAVENNVEVGVQADEEGITQVYFDYDGRRNILTHERRTSANPYVDREYIVWVSEIQGSWQIFLYNIISKTVIQLTSSGNNVNPKVSGGRVVWESWDSDTGVPAEGTWQVHLYDGISILKLTSGDMSINPEIEGDYVVYGRKNQAEVWRAVGYSIQARSWIDVAIGEKARYPRIKDKKIKLGLSEGFQEELSLRIDDMFLLELGSTPLETPSGIPTTIEALQAEIASMTGMATESGIMQ